MSKVLLVREWDPDLFHRRVAELEAQGYQAQRDTYRILAEVHPETGVITHLHSIEMRKPEPGES